MVSLEWRDEDRNSLTRCRGSTVKLTASWYLLPIVEGCNDLLLLLKHKWDPSNRCWSFYTDDISAFARLSGDMVRDYRTPHTRLIELLDKC
jgi:hypothetical protein